MKKKLILILSMVVLCVSLFAIGVSADSFTANNLEFVTYDLPSYFVDPNSIETEPFILFNDVGLPGYFESNSYTFYYNEGSNSDLVEYLELFYASLNNPSCMVYNFKVLKAYLETKDVVDFSSFNVWRKQLDVHGSLEYLLSTINEELYNELFTFEDEPTYSEADLTAKYNEGYSAGYINGQSDGIEFGYSDGYEQGYRDSSNAFAEGLKNGIDKYVNETYPLTGNSSSSLYTDIRLNLSDEQISACELFAVGSSIDFMFYQCFSSSSGSSHGTYGSMVTEKGDNYGNSHNGNIDIYDSDCCYNPGYYDGVLDGGDTYKNSEQWDIDVNNEINEYMQSTEYKALMNQYSTEVINEYLLSAEYRAALDSSVAVGEAIGEANAYDRAYDEVLTQGRTEGYNSFRGSQEYLDALDSSSYVGYKKGVEDGKNSVVDPTGVIALIVILAVLGLIVFVVSKKSHGKKNFKKK